MFVKMTEYIGFYVYRKSYQLWSPVTVVCGCVSCCRCGAGVVGFVVVVFVAILPRLFIARPRGSGYGHGYYYQV